MREGNNAFSGAIQLVTVVATIGTGIFAYIKISDYLDKKKEEEEIKKKADLLKKTATTGDTIAFTGQNFYGKVVTVRVLDTVRTLKGELLKPEILVNDDVVMKELLGYPYKYLKYLRQFFLYTTGSNLNDMLQQKLKKENWDKARQYLAMEPVEKAKKPASGTAKAMATIKGAIKK